MGPNPEIVVRRLFELLDDRDVDGIEQILDPDVVAVDEIMRAWLRGREQVAGSIRATLGETEWVRSTLDDLHVQTVGTAAVVTVVLRQSYRYRGADTHLTAPTSIVLCPSDTGWRIATIHSVPLAAAE